MQIWGINIVELHVRNRVSVKMH